MKASELWSPMTELPLGNDIIAVDQDGNWKHYDEVYKSDFGELINDGYIKWCYLADLVQAAYEMFNLSLESHE